MRGYRRMRRWRCIVRIMRCATRIDIKARVVKFDELADGTQPLRRSIEELLQPGSVTVHVMRRLRMCAEGGRQVTVRPHGAGARRKIAHALPVGIHALEPPHEKRIRRSCQKESRHEREVTVQIGEFLTIQEVPQNCRCQCNVSCSVLKIRAGNRVDAHVFGRRCNGGCRILRVTRRLVDTLCYLAIRGLETIQRVTYEGEQLACAAGQMRRARVTPGLEIELEEVISRLPDVLVRECMRRGI